MKTTIFYFSGTGNSLKVAQDLAIKLGDSTIVPITSFLKKMDKLQFHLRESVLFIPYICGGFLK